MTQSINMVGLYVPDQDEVMGSYADCNEYASWEVSMTDSNITRASDGPPAGQLLLGAVCGAAIGGDCESRCLLNCLTLGAAMGFLIGASSHPVRSRLRLG